MKAAAEANARQNQIDELARLEKEIGSKDAKTNPMYEQIQQCDELLKFCAKSLGKAEAAEETKKADGPGDAGRTNKDLAKKLQSGSLEAAKSKAEKEKEAFEQLGGGRNKKGKKGGQQAATDKQIDFKLIQQFNNLKVSAPLDDADFEKTQQDL
jgi:hypothetical protein